MSSTLVCRNSMSCSDLQETTTTLKLKNPETYHQTIHDFGSWGFLQTHPSKHCSQDQEKDNNTCRYSCSKTTTTTTMSNITAKPYNSLPRLSQQSLELCTENLGSETGTDTIFASDFPQEPSNHFTPQERISSAVKLRKSPCEKTMKSSTFPPPLTTMVGSSPLQVTRHIENGRLIIEAVERPIRNGVLQAERGGGRLRLSFLKPPENGGDEAEEENTNESHEVEKDFDGVNDKYRWISRCKQRGHGANINISDDSNWNKPALWVVTS